MFIRVLYSGQTMYTACVNNQRRTGMKKILCAMLAVLLLFAVGCKQPDQPKQPEESDVQSKPKATAISQKQGKCVSYTYSFGSYFGEYNNYSLYTAKDGKVYVTAYSTQFEEMEPVEVPAEILSGLDDVIEQNGVLKWDGFDKSDNNVMDGYGFSLEVGYENGTSLKASGYMKEPKNYQAGHDAMVEYLESIPKLVPLALVDYDMPLRSVSLTTSSGEIFSYRFGSGEGEYKEHGTFSYVGDYVSEVIPEQELDPALLMNWQAAMLNLYNKGLQKGAAPQESKRPFVELYYGSGNFLLKGTLGNIAQACPREYDVALQAGFALLGLQPQNGTAEKGARDYYYSSYILYNRDTFGEILLDFEAFTITVNGKVYKQQADDMLILYNQVAGKSSTLTWLMHTYDEGLFYGLLGETEYPGALMQAGFNFEGKTPQQVYGGVDKQQYAWLLGRIPRTNNILALYGAETADRSAFTVEKLDEYAGYALKLCGL